MNDPVYSSTQGSSHSVYVHWMRDVFSDKRIKKSFGAIFWSMILKLNQEDTRVNYNKGSVIQRLAEKRKKKKTKKARQTANWIYFSFVENRCS